MPLLLANHTMVLGYDSLGFPNLLPFKVSTITAILHAINVSSPSVYHLSIGVFKILRRHQLCEKKDFALHLKVFELIPRMTP